MEMRADAKEQCAIVLAGTSAQAVNWNAERALDAFPDSLARDYLVRIARYNQWRQV